MSIESYRNKNAQSPSESIHEYLLTNELLSANCLCVQEFCLKVADCIVAFSAFNDETAKEHLDIRQLVAPLYRRNSGPHSIECLIETVQVATSVAEHESGANGCIKTSRVSENDNRLHCAASSRTASTVRPYLSSGGPLNSVVGD